MNITQATEVAKGISDYGMMAITTAFYLIISAAMMIAIFKWFKAIINQMLESQREDIKSLTDIQRENNQMLALMSDGLKAETQIRIRNLSGFAFDLAIENVCRLIKKVREENHIIDREATEKKIRKALQVIHDDRKTRFDPFTFKGKALSEYFNPDWVEEVAKVVEGEIYNDDGPNNGRAYTNVKLAYDDIKTEFYQRLNN